jgi:2-hydroxy-6-oxonona-2,4-dienedioate hydrolase
LPASRPDEPAAELLDRLRRDAREFRSPCGSGDMVWRAWGAGPALVLLHGGYGSWTHWLRNVDALAARYRVVAADLPGLGDSAMPPAPVTPESLAVIIEQGLRQVLSPGERFHLVGFSFGAMLGMGLRRAPMREMKPLRQHMTAAEIAQLQRTNLGILMFADAGRIDDLAIRLQQENVARARVKSRRFAPLGLLRPVLPRITAPLGGIWGERDITAYPWVDDRRDLLRQIQPDAFFAVIPGAGHWVMYEAADAFNRVLLDRLASL